MLFETFIKYSSFSISLLSSVLLIEIFINFKKPFNLKLLFLLIATSISIYNLSILLNWPFYVSMISRFFIISTGIIILYYLYKLTINRKIVVICAFLFCLILIYLNIDFIPWKDILVLNIFRVSIKLLLIIIFLYLYLTIFWKLISSLQDNNLYSKKVRKWIIFFIVIFLVAVVNNIYLQFFQSQILVIRCFNIFTHLAICLLIFYRPKFINRTELAISLGKAFSFNAIAQINEDKFILEFYTNQYYLNQQANLEQFALLINVKSNFLSEYINKKTKLSFNDLVNKNRVEHFVFIATSNKYENLTIEGLSSICGFGSKQSFYRYFKKFHGGSPSDLIMINQ